MRNITIILVFLCTLLLSADKVSAQTTLSAGDIAFVGYNSAAATDDDFSFILLTNVSAGTTIRFTDFGWCSDINGFQSANPCGSNTGALGDGAVSWTSSTALPCGTQVRIQCKTTLTASTGSVTGLQATFNNSSVYMDLATGGESIFAFQGTLASPSLISALNMNGGWDVSLAQCTFTSGASALPAALASYNLVKSPETDNATYNCSTTNNSPANLRAAIYNNTNWAGADGAANVYALPITCTFSCNACTAPSVTSHPPNRTVCAGGSTTFPISATGTGLTYQWQVNTGSGFSNLSNTAPYSNVTTATLTVTTATAGLTGYTYRCVVTGTCGTANSNAATLTVSSVSPNPSQLNVACFGGNNGQATVAPSGGVSSYTYVWSPGGATTATISGLSAGGYSVVITDNIGCTATGSFTITQPSAALSGSTSVTGAACNGNTNGKIDLTPVGGTGPYTYNWGGGVTSQDRTGLAAGTYSVTITDANNCTATVGGISVTQPAVVSGTTTITNVVCNGGNNGAIDVTPTGGTPGYTYSWGGGVTTQDRTGLAAGSYVILITDAMDCRGYIFDINVTQPAVVSGSTTVTNVTCNGGTNGLIDLTPTGGTPPYTYNWGGGVTTQDRTGLAPGTYSVAITDANGCTGTVSGISITQPAVVSGNTTKINIACFGGSTGAINLTPTGGTSPYTFNWGGGITTEDRTSLSAGTYSVTITDANNCTGTVSGISITQPSATVSGSTVVTDASCDGSTNGSIDLTPAGGTAPYTYNWGGGVTTQDRTGISAGTYSVAITDANGCTGNVGGISVTQPSAVSGSTVVTNASCNGSTNGSINLTPSGGTGPYTYNWGGGVTTEDRTGLAAGTYSVTITDANNCTGTVSSIAVTQPTAVSGSTAITGALCNGAANGSIDLTPTGGTPGYTYNWGGGVTTQDRTGLAAGTYSVTITDANGCNGTVSGISVTQPAVVSGNTTKINIACFGGSTGAINLTPTGGTSPYTFNWGGGITTEDRTSLSAGTYSVTITDANNCTGTVSGISITQPSATVSGSTVVTDASCDGSANGSIDLTPSGGTAPYTYNWGGGVTTQDRTGLTAGTYSVAITDANGCTGTVGAISVTQPAIVSGTTTITNVACFGGNTGAINLTPVGGTGAYTYNWGGGVTTEDRTGLAAGTYSVTITDENNCTGTVSSIAVTQPTAVSGSTAITGALCNGAPNGSIDLTPTGGTPGYTYNWGGGVTTQDRTGLSAGTYSVTITDANGCTGTVSGISVTQPAVVSGSTTKINIACFGGNTGAINLTPSGGTGTYTFNWGGGITTEDRTGLSAGTYSVTITDANNCTGTVSGISITQPAAAVSGSTLVTNASCDGSANGSIDLTPAGGTAPYTYNWGGGVTTQDRTGLTAGTYSVAITDANGCTGTVGGISVTQPAVVSGTTTITNVACFGGNTGAINLTPAGGTGAYTYNWGGGITTEDRTGLAAGTYSVTITDANNCTGTVSSIAVTQPTAVSGSTTITNALCNGAANGSIDLTPTGGTPGYTYNWGGGVTTQDRTGLTAGTYSVAITDANGCTGTVSGISVTQPAVVSGNTTKINIACFGGSTGAINLTPTGGTGAYTFNWGGGIMTEDRTSLSAGTYSVTITDANNCTGTVSGISITQPAAAVSGSTVVTNASCDGSTNGSIDLTPAGGTAPYTYNWGGGVTTQDRTGLTAGTYSVAITDANGCTGTVGGISVTQPAIVSGTTTITNVACFGGNTGAINLTPAGGTGAYTYNWGGGVTTQDRTGLTAGTYSVTITDANNCTGTLSSIAVTQPTAVSGTTLATGALCNGAANGSIDLTPTGGTPGYTYNWGGGVTTQDRTGIAAGTYSVIITDANNCTATVGGISVTQPSAVSGITVITNVACFSGNTGAINLTPGGGTGTYTFNWGGGITTEDRTGLSAGTYSVTITDANNCTGTVSGISITQPSAAVSGSTVVTNASCNGSANGSIDLTPAGGTAPYTYNWGGGITTQDRTGLAAGTYSVTITDANSCTATISGITVTQPAIVSGTTTITNVACFGGNTGAINLTPAGGTGAYTYNWGGVTTQDRTGLTAGTYSVTITDANNCTGTVSNIAVTQPTILTGSTLITNVTCNGGTNGSIDLTPAGGTPGYTYNWSGGVTTQDRTGLAADSYSVTITDANACTTTISAAVSQPVAIAVYALTGGGAYCTGGSGVAVGLANSETGVNYQLYRGVSIVGSAIAGTGSALNFGNQTVAGTYTIVATNTATLCTANMSGSATVVINPIPDVNTVSNQTLCSGAGTAAIVFNGAVGGTTYTWTNNTTSIGLGSTGTGNIGSFTGTNSTNAPVTATITVTPTAAGCPGTAGNFTITVNPTPTVNTIANQVLCNTATTTVATFSGSVGSATYSWTNNTTSIGLAASGNGNIPAFTATNGSNAPITASITVIPTANGCQGASKAFTITVNPTPSVAAIADQTVCNAAQTTAVNFMGSAVASTTYSWTNNTTSIGLPASGTGNIASFTVVNSGSVPVTSTITVTPTANGCAGADQAFTIAVNPTPSVAAVSNQVLCNGASTSAVNFSGSAVAGTTYSWTNNTASIGLAASGTGNITSFNAVNAGSAPVTATINVTPIANGCPGATQSFSITVNPTPTVNTIASQVVCNGAPTTSVAFGGAVSGTGYSWTNNTTSIGLAASGNGNIPAFTASNAGSAPVNATITVTPNANGCSGTNKTFTITVNPTPDVNTIASQTLCNGAGTTAIAFSGAVAGTAYSWTNNTTAIGLGASGSGNIASFTALNTGTTPVTATITVTPSANGCTGTSKTLTITVNPTPTVNALASQVVCNNAPTTSVVFSGAVAGTAYNWTNSNTAINLAATGLGDIAAFNATNTTNAPISGTVTVTPVANGCIGSIKNFTITVNPTPTVNAMPNQVLCNNENSTAIVFSGSVSGTVYSWSNSHPSIGLASNGTGDIGVFTAENTGTAPVIATISVTPQANSCGGTPQIFTITVNPTPVVDAVTDQQVCNNASTAAVNFTSAVSGTTYTWTNSNTNIGLAAAGSGNIGSFTGINNTTAPLTGTITVTPTANGCIGPDVIFEITINPTPKLTSTQTPPAICDNGTFSYVPASATAGTAFAWSRAVVAGISNAAATGNNNPGEVLHNTTANPVVVTYVYTLTANSCGNIQNVTVVVNPTPKLSNIVNDSICSGALFTYAPASQTSGTTFTWLRPSVAGIVPATTGSGTNGITEIVMNNMSAPVIVSYIYTLTANGCTNSDTITVKVNPLPFAPLLATTSQPELCAQTMYQNFGANMPAPAGVSYAWTATNADVWAGATKQYCLVNFMSPGTSVVTLTSTINASGCQSQTSYHVSVSANVAPNPQITYYNNRFICLLNGLDSYVWGYDDKSNLDSTLIPNQTSQDYINATPDFDNRNYWVLVSNGGCFNKCYYNKPSTVAQATAESYAISIYPNPARDNLTVVYEHPDGSFTNLTVTDASGRVIMQQPMYSKATHINVAELSPGMYVINCYSKDAKVASSRFVKID